MVRAAAALLVLGGCGPRPAASEAGESGDTGAETSSTSGGESGTGPDSDVPADVPAWEMVPPLCGEDPPPGGQSPPPPPVYSGGACPTLAPGLNVLQSSGFYRELLLVLPSDIDPDERLPLLFLWHWQQGTADDFLVLGDVQTAADLFRFAAVIPEAKGDVTFEWPYALSDPDARLQEELVFFDDMLACVVEQFEIDPACVSSTGVSAGALMTAQLGGHRGDYLASILSLSGGVGGLSKGWSAPPHKMPALVLWGGPTDMCLVFDFETTSRNLEDELTADGHFLVECIHNCGHAEPPFDVPGAPTPFAPVWQFALDHPYWLEDGESPYLDGLPAGLPTWCAVGQGNAEPRTGEGCPEPGC